MFTNDQILQLQELFRAERVYTREMVDGLGKRIDGLDQRVGSLGNRMDDSDKRMKFGFLSVNKGIAQLNNRMDESDARMELEFQTVKIQIASVIKQQDQDRRDWTDFFHEAGVFFDEMRKKITYRIERIENHVGLE